MATLVVMAAGIGSRYGGMKQIDPIGQNGEILLEYAAFDAIKAGFSKIIFILREEMIPDFKVLWGDSLSKHIEVIYATQSLDILPDNFIVPNDRTKPWGTGHAVYCARHLINEPFCVINADDFYGREAYQKMHSYLTSVSESKPYACAMIGFRIENTLTDFGTVSRGVCEKNNDDMLVSIVEMAKIERVNGIIKDAETDLSIPTGTNVSMNFWGFPCSILDELESSFISFLSNLNNPQKDEFYLPFFVDSLLKQGTAIVKIIETATKWHGITYREDKKTLANAVATLTQQGIYPKALW